MDIGKLNNNFWQIFWIFEQNSGHLSIFRRLGKIWFLINILSFDKNLPKNPALRNDFSFSTFNFITFSWQNFFGRIYRTFYVILLLLFYYFFFYFFSFFLFLLFLFFSFRNFFYSIHVLVWISRYAVRVGNYKYFNFHQPAATYTCPEPFKNDRIRYRMKKLSKDFLQYRSLVYNNSIPASSKFQKQKFYTGND